MRGVTALPGFTAEVAVGSGGSYRMKALAPVGEAIAITPQQRVAGLGPVGEEAPATTCTCPCCQTKNGVLYCC